MQWRVQNNLKGKAWPRSLDRMTGRGLGGVDSAQLNIGLVYTSFESLQIVI